MTANFLRLGRRYVGSGYSPLVIAEIGINHRGHLDLATDMVRAAKGCGCECVKFQCHIADKEMSPHAKKVITGTGEDVYSLIDRCSLSQAEDFHFKQLVEREGMIYLSTPFSAEAALRLARMSVEAFKIGSGECNNRPLVRHIAGFGKPVILSTGMNNLPSVARSVEILREAKVPFALLQCTSIYPTPVDKVHLRGMEFLRKRFPDAVVGLSDHTTNNYAAFAAVGMGASIIEKHFTCSSWLSGPDIPVSANPQQMRDLVDGVQQAYTAIGSGKNVLPEEESVAEFAFASVVSTREIAEGELLDRHNVWVKRPGTGPLQADDLDQVYGRTAACVIPADMQLTWDMIA